ncbi:MAG: glycosyltransferase family 4 protein [Candidatus Aminicenantes bacterium]|nr:glycosyltransferase family 4 protein [Candidatus Aminicenantes bacterium]
MSNSIDFRGKIRILEMIDRPSLGGGQTALLLLASHLDRRQFEVFISSGGGGPLVEESGKAGIPHFRVSLGKKFSPGVIKEIAELLRKMGISILHTHGGVAGFFGRLAARRARTPVVVHTLHGIHYLHYRTPGLRRLYILLEQMFSRLTDALILVCHADFQKAQKFRLAPVEKMFVIPNGIDLKTRFSPDEISLKRQSLRWPPDSPVVGTVARLHRQKGIDYLLEAAPFIFSAVPEARVAVVGDGPWDQKLRKKARRAGLEGKFYFLGERKEATELLSLFDIFVLPSLWEGLPFVLIEAASLQKPIVATAVDGVIEIIEDEKTGLLVPPRNPRALAEAVISLLLNREKARRLGEWAGSTIPPRFPLRRMVEQTASLYLELFLKQPRSSQGPLFH